MTEVLAGPSATTASTACTGPTARAEPDLEDLLTRQGFLCREGTPPLGGGHERPHGADPESGATIQEPLCQNHGVLAAIQRGHRRLQTALTSSIPGSWYSPCPRRRHPTQRLLEMITAYNEVPSVPTEPREAGTGIVCPVREDAPGKIVPNTVTKTIPHRPGLYPGPVPSSMEPFPTTPIQSQIRTIKSFDRPVILVDDLMHPGFRIQALDPILRQEGWTSRVVLVGLLSGHGRDLMDAQGRSRWTACTICPACGKWFVESTLYPFIGATPSAGPRLRCPACCPASTISCPMPPPPSGECSEEAVFQLSRVCLESARDVISVLEQEYRALYGRNLTLSRLPEASIILPLCPDKGTCLDYDPNLAASVYLENDLEQLMRTHA